MIPVDLNLEARCAFHTLRVRAARGPCGPVVAEAINQVVERIGGFGALASPDAAALLPAFIAAWRQVMIEAAFSRRTIAFEMIRGMGGPQ